MLLNAVVGVLARRTCNLVQRFRIQTPRSFTAGERARAERQTGRTALCRDQMVGDPFDAEAPLRGEGDPRTTMCG